MSGHSKWANIKNRKGAQDKKRSETFTKLAKNIITAIRNGGGNTHPEVNMQLRMAIDKAKQSNMPKDNIDRLLAKFEAKKNSLVSCSFEGFGPWGVPLIVEVETDNKNRIISEIKNIFKKNNGNIGENGSVAYLFDRVGEIEVANLSEESKLSLIDVPGVIDFEQEMVITTASKIKEVLGEIKQRGWEVVRDGLVLRARLPVKLNTENEVEQVMNLIDELESQDDVVAVYSGFDYQP